MNKLISLILILLICSCSNNNDIEDQLLISFDNAKIETSELSQKAPSTNGLENYSNSFIVFGYKTMQDNSVKNVINNYTVSFNNTWDYITASQTAKYWDFSASKYRFYGYVNARAVTTYDYSVNVNYNKFIFNNLYYFTSSDSINDSDLPLYSKMWCGNPTGESPVTLEFVRPFSQINIKIIRTSNTVASDFTNIKFYPVSDSIIGSGNVVVNYDLTKTSESLEINETTKLKELTFNDLSKTFNEKSDTIYEIMPVYYMLSNTDQADYEFSIDVNGLTKLCSVPAAYMKWDPNHQYTYIFKITDTNVSLINVNVVCIKNWDTYYYDKELYNW